MVAGRYQSGRNIAFEVMLTLAELQESMQSAGGGLAGSPALIGAVNTESGGIGGCPEVNQYVWADNYKAIKAKTLVEVKKDICLYNPVTRNFNKVTAAEIVEDQPLFKVRTTRDVETIVSQSHKAIVNTSQLNGMFLVHYGVGREIMTFDEGKQGRIKHWNIYIDTLVEMSDAGRGSVVKISLDNEFIYACGMTKSAGLVSHNRKEFEIG